MYVTMITIIDVDIFKWCKLYSKTSLLRTQTSRFHGYKDLR